MSVLTLHGRLPYLHLFGFDFDLVKYWPSDNRSWAIWNVGDFNVEVYLIHTSSTVQDGIMSQSNVKRFERFTVSTSSVTLPVIKSIQSRNLSQLPGSVKDTSTYSTILSVASLKCNPCCSNGAVEDFRELIQLVAHVHLACHWVHRLPVHLL